MQGTLYGVWEAMSAQQARREPRCKGSSIAVWEALSAQPGGNHDAREALRQSGRP
ncbi:hypothetical protein DPMN_168149 [Dreissena polymorpha]|uniref:Uncharacterized protein n=1 Tax=Dreissena polymorpha TaxID=45954 RepID=A0A9D4F185_DREPO|nr:hypothetical protein DPMN_168149 [Dreissena polymorpha]